MDLYISHKEHTDHADYGKHTILMHYIIEYNIGSSAIASLEKVSVKSFYSEYQYQINKVMHHRYEYRKKDFLVLMQTR